MTSLINIALVLAVVIVVTVVVLALLCWLVIALVHPGSRRTIAWIVFGAHGLGYLIINGLIALYNIVVLPHQLFFPFILIPWTVILIVHGVLAARVQDAEVNFP